MKRLTKDFKIDVAALKQQLLAGKITKDRFKIDLTATQIYDILYSAYLAEVSYRKRKMVIDRETKNNIYQIAQFFYLPSSHFGLLFCGIHGNGKTTMVKSIQSMFSYLSSIGYDNMPTLSIIDAVDLFYLAEDYKAFKEMKNKPFLALEDIGREPRDILKYGNRISPITEMIEHRYNEQLFTIITTNLTPKEIRENYGDRIADRLNEMVVSIIYQGSTYRR